MTVLRWIVRVVVALIVLIAIVIVGARFHDGPLGPLPGGPLVRGAIVAEPIGDWTFAADVAEIELQLEAQSKSRTVWILVSDAKAYIPAATEYPPGKTWHRSALEDGRATLRIADKRYPVTLRKVDDPAVLDAVREIASHKYPSRPGGEAWLFEVTSRPSAASSRR